MADLKVSIRFFDDVPVRSVWDDETAKWWMCAADVVAALADILCPDLSGKVIKAVKDICMDLLQTSDRADFNGIDQSALKELISLLFALFINRASDGREPPEENILLPALYNGNQRIP